MIFSGRKALFGTAKAGIFSLNFLDWILDLYLRSNVGPVPTLDRAMIIARFMIPITIASMRIDENERLVPFITNY